MPFAIAIKNLRKNYGAFAALRGIDLEIPQGQFFGLLGPNGAGKTTLINSIVGLVKPQAGEVLVFGDSVARDPIKTRAKIGFSPQEINTDRFFNLQRTLEFQGGFFGLAPQEAKLRTQELMEQLGLLDKAKEQFYRLSGGMQKRLMIARALMSRPRLLILDEPTAGVDVEQRHQLWKHLRALQAAGTTILLTTHYIDEAEALCERVGIINHGKIIELGSPKNLIEKYCHTEVQVTANETLSGQEFYDFKNAVVSGAQIKIPTKQIGETVEQITARLLAKPGRKLADLNVQRGNLEDVFIHLTGKTILATEKETHEKPSRF